MRARRTKGALLSLVMTAVVAVAVVRAHEATFQGTVLAVEAATLQVKTIDLKTKKEDSVWFQVNKDTKVERGDKKVTYADAHIVRGERIVVTVDHDAKIKMLATKIQLAPKAAGRKLD